MLVLSIDDTFHQQRKLFHNRQVMAEIPNITFWACNICQEELKYPSMTWGRFDSIEMGNIGFAVLLTSKQTI
jgi:hypothetical protein